LLLAKLSVLFPLNFSRSRLALDWQRAEFADADIERRFVRQFLPERNRQLQASLLFAACFYVVFGATDFAELGVCGTAWSLAALRVLVALIALGGRAALARWPESARVSTAAASTLLVAAAGVFMAVCWYQPDALAWNTMSHALIVMAVYVYFPNRFIYAVAIGIGSSVVFGAMLTVQGNLGTGDLLTLTLLLVLGNALGYLASSRIHIAQRRQFRSALLLEQMADRDPLTACYNRRVLQKGVLEKELARTRRFGTAFSVIIGDIDHFKRINDVHGHAAGDRILADFAAIMLSTTRETVDMVIRYGGEEFLILLPQTDAAGAHATAHRIRLSFAEAALQTASGAILSATASFGIATIPARDDRQAVSPETLIGAADEQLYEVKRNGRNGVRGTVFTASRVHETDTDVAAHPALREGR
jgi:diguanylate cyclase (GGDEF)-like protein